MWECCLMCGKRHPYFDLVMQRIIPTSNFEMEIHHNDRESEDGIFLLLRIVWFTSLNLI